jgi:hypothetical protein
MKELEKINRFLDIAAVVFIMGGVVMQISVYAVVAVAVVWLFGRGITTLLEKV